MGLGTTTGRSTAGVGVRVLVGVIVGVAESVAVGTLGSCCGGCDGVAGCDGTLVGDSASSVGVFVGVDPELG